MPGWTLVLPQWLGQQRLAGIAEGVLGHRSEVVSRIESVAGGCLDECVHRGRHFRSQDGLAPVVIFSAHDHPAKVALDRVIVDGNSWILRESGEPFPQAQHVL